MRKRAAIMARVSSDEQAKGYSLDIQSESLEKYCERNDIEIVYSFREDHSAKNFDRPAFKEFMNHAKNKKGQIDLFLFTSWDRFSRNIMDAYTVIERLKKLGIAPQAIEQPIDLTIPENKAILAMFLVIPEIDNDRRSIKVRGGIRGALKAGRWSRMAPVGYKNVRDENNRPLIIPNEKASSIKWAFEEVAKGKTQIGVVRELHVRGVRVQKSRFSLMLKNPMYMGKIEIPEFEDEPYQMIEGVHEGIVPEKTFNRVQQVLSGNFKRKRISRQVQNKGLPLRGFLICSKCNAKMTGSRSRSRNGNRYTYYHCNQCSKERYPAEKINSTVIEILNELKFHNDFMIVYQKAVEKLLQDDRKADANLVPKLRKEIELNKARINRLQDNLADGILDGQEYKELKVRYSHSVEEAERRLTGLSKDKSSINRTVKKATKVISKLGELYSNSGLNEKQALLGSIFPEMLEFDGVKCRTTKINPAVPLCLSIDRGFSQTKKWTFPKKLEVSTLVGASGFEPPLSRPPDAHFNRAKLHPELWRQMYYFS